MKIQELPTVHTRQSRVANLLVTSGIVSVTAGAWIVHPSAGLVVAGIVAVLVGIGIVRNEQ